MLQNARQVFKSREVKDIFDFLIFYDRSYVIRNFLFVSFLACHTAPNA